METSRAWEWTRDRVEQVAEALHDGWWQFYRDAGWSLGPVRDREKKVHPHLVPWSALDESNRNQDRFLASLLLARRDGDYSTRVAEDEIHEAWRRWIVAHNGAHFHARPYDEAHPDGPCEHRQQAERVNALFAEWKR